MRLELYIFKWNFFRQPVFIGIMGSILSPYFTSVILVGFKGVINQNPVMSKGAILSVGCRADICTNSHGHCTKMCEICFRVFMCSIHESNKSRYIADACKSDAILGLTFLCKISEYVGTATTHYTYIYFFYMGSFITFYAADTYISDKNYEFTVFIK